MRISNALLVIALVVFCCRPPTPDQSEKTKASLDENGVVRTYNAEGHLKTSIPYHDGEKHGKSLLYYDGGDQVMLEMPYQKGKRHGIATKYYEDGSIYAVTPYKDDEVDGIVKLYFRSGKLKAEIPYSMSRHGLGLREYLTNGELKTSMPEINIRTERLSDQLVYYFTIDNCREANFFIGSLLSNRYLIDQPPFVDILPLRNGEAVYSVPVNQSGPVNVICQCRTKAGNPYVARKVIQ